MQMKTYEMKWCAAGTPDSFRSRTDIVKANSLEEATNMIEAQARMLGATGVDWISKKEIS